MTPFLLNYKIACHLLKCVSQLVPLFPVSLCESATQFMSIFVRLTSRVVSPGVSNLQSTNLSLRAAVVATHFNRVDLDCTWYRNVEYECWLAPGIIQARSTTRLIERVPRFPFVLFFVFFFQSFGWYPRLHVLRYECSEYAVHFLSPLIPV